MSLKSEIKKILAPGGAFSETLDGYEYREGQIELSLAIADAITEKGNLLAEAGTGIGKTVAYLIPAVITATEGGTPAVISTRTIALQSQIVDKDIPMLRKVLKGRPFSASVMKGRSNYLCLRELDHAASSILRVGDGDFAKLMKWAGETQTGDWSDLDFSFSDWNEVCCNAETCKNKDCPYFFRDCFYYKMRRKAEMSDIIVTNHSLFFADLVIRNEDPDQSLLPEYSMVVLDEAHHIEDAATKAFGLEISDYRTVGLMNRISKRRDIAVTRSEYKVICDQNDLLFSVFNDSETREEFYDVFCEKYGKKVVEGYAEELIEGLQSLYTQLCYQEPDTEELRDRLDGFKKMLSGLKNDFTELFFGDHDKDYFRWAETVSDSRFVSGVLHLTPRSVDNTLAKYLWDKRIPVICTSATLAAAGNFDYMRKNLGIRDCGEIVVESPFDFMNRVVLYVPDDLPAPSNDREYADMVARKISEVITATQGHAFLLFTSYRMLDEVASRLGAMDLPFTFLRQGEMSNENLIREFRERDDVCLLGTHSFWEGVDIKGEKLTCVIMDKLPFAVPNTPMSKSKCYFIESGGGNAFADFSVPQAQTKLKQGFGRLIRTKNDYGIVAIMDSRIHTKRYGMDFIRCLPRCKGVKRTDRLPEIMENMRKKFGTKE